MIKKIELVALFVLIFITNVRAENCSTHNPCGQYGYCEDDSSGDSECQCKFWWVGTYCNEQSSSGIQVIVLGVLSAVLIIVFYGLSILFWIRGREIQPEEEKESNDENDVLNPKLTHLALTNVKESTRFSSCFVTILVLVITTVALVVEWSLLQPIHNELVNKYKQDELLFYNRNSFCDLIDLEDFNMLTFPIACLFVLIFAVFSKRTSFMRNKLKGYFGPAIPLDFYIHIKRKFAAVVFAAISDELLDIVTQIVSGDTSGDEGVIVVYLLRIATVLVIGLRYYPILSAVYIDTILALTCAMFYAWLDFSVSIVYQGLCESDFYPSNENFDDTNGTDLIDFFQFYGTGQNLIIIQLFTDLPRYLCWAYIVVKLPMLLITKIHKTIKSKNRNSTNHLHLTREEKMFLHSSAPHSVEMSYVRNLFRPIHRRSTSRLFFGRVIPKFIYQWRDDFRFSSRIVCVYASVFFLLIFMTIQVFIYVLPDLDDLQKTLQDGINQLTNSSNLEGTQSEFPLPNFQRPFIIAVLTAFVIIVIQLLILLANIRRNLFQIYRGDDSEIPKRNNSNCVSYSTGNFHFAGYFIGYLLWGYVLITILVFIIYVCIASFIEYGSVRFLEKILKSIIPVLLFVVFKSYLNKLLARYVFLQHYGDVLAINNRRVLMIFLYFNFFLDSFLGFVSSIVRIIQSVIGGCLYMTRLDYSPLGRKLETLDSGFSAYCGFIHIEAVHRNPIMLTAASYLYSRMKAKQYMTKNPTMIIQKDGTNSKDYSSKAIRKWHLAVLLIRNPSLVFSRKNALREDETKKMANLDEQQKRLSCIVQMSHRPSLISEFELQYMWQKNIN